MMLFDADGKIRRYETPEQIVQEFFDLRLSFYAKRKAALLKVGGFCFIVASFSRNSHRLQTYSATEGTPSHMQSACQSGTAPPCD